MKKKVHILAVSYDKEPCDWYIYDTQEKIDEVVAFAKDKCQYIQINVLEDNLDIIDLEYFCSGYEKIDDLRMETNEFWENEE